MGEKTEKDLLQGKTVLIADDEPDVLETLEEILSMCEVVKATTFDRAKELLEAQQIDIAVLDIMGIDGYGLLKIAMDRKIPAVMLTAHALSVEETVRSYKKGADSYVPKEEIEKVPLVLSDVLEAREKGRHSWWRWLIRLGPYYDKRFGPNWQEREKEFWEQFKYRV